MAEEALKSLEAGAALVLPMTKGDSIQHEEVTPGRAFAEAAEEEAGKE